MGKSSFGEMNMDKQKFILGMKILVVCTTFGVLVVFYSEKSFVRHSSSFYFAYGSVLKCCLTLLNELLD